MDGAMQFRRPVTLSEYFLKQLQALNAVNIAVCGTMLAAGDQTMARKYFGTDGIRGRANGVITPELALQGRAGGRARLPPRRPPPSRA